MRKQRSDIAHRAWNILHLAVLWARKVTGPNPLWRTRALLRKKNPIIHFKMHRPLLMRFQTSDPMHNPHGDFDYDFESNDDDDDDFVNCYNDGVREGIMMGGRDEDKGHEVCEAIIPGDEGIDHKADQFIAKFYEQMKLQRQISYLQLNEMLNSSTS